MEIFWTGGWDSSFRIIALAEKEVIIQPYYLGDNRKSERNELNAIDEIKGELLRRNTTKCVFRPLEILQSSEVKEDASITRAYHALQSMMGSQYDWLARFAKEHRGIELCIHKDDRALHVISTLGKVRYLEHEIVGGYYEIDEARSHPDVVQLFGNLRLPLLDVTKLEMKELSQQRGTFPLLQKTWFCHRPVSGEPCGVCNPCRSSIEEGMEFRFSKGALRRYRWRTSRIRRTLSRVKSATYRWFGKSKHPSS